MDPDPKPSSTSQKYETHPSPTTTIEGDISQHGHHHHHHGAALSPTISVISSTSSSDNSNPDPLEPLEHALAQTTSITRTRTGRTSIGSVASRPPDFEVILEADDPDNPKNWPLWYRTYTLVTISYATWLIVLYSTSYTATLTPIMEEFGITSRPVATLGLTSYLFGLAAGSVIVAPLSELYGRRPIYLICLSIFVLLIIPCGLAKNLATLVGVRFVGALFGAAMISNSPGTVVDVSKEGRLALAMSLWSIAPLNGPVTGPLIGGFVGDYLGWRWGNWLALILGGVALVMVYGVKETYHPALVKAKTAKMRKETGDERYWCQYEDDNLSKKEVILEGLKRPFVLAVTEPILWFFNVWISIIYGILYLCFVAYPIVFSQHRGWSSSQTGLSFLGIGLGTLLSIFLEPLWRRIINSSPKRDPLTGRASPEATALVMSIGAVLTPIGQLAFSWTCLPASIHPAIPISFGILFGMGNTLSFIYGSNYIAGAYGIYAASALAGNAVLRSAAGALLPLAGPAMYKAMTPRWAGTFLGLLEVLLIPIPFMFYKWGDRIRGKSRLIQRMREERARDEKRAERRERVLRRGEEGKKEDEKKKKEGNEVV
ncbi:citrinin biosynthesis cluster MFS transporter mrr1 [Podospora fimiseda]|uniref:Citrinin biosynthesis cluster MFS transporter mrr1 n=1 Tax=Podospora fimiseda TaxID=252190 RepID=A0AAN7BYG3_9PEZI|nr:citrinin biosynthesis cluster MFS transporter mrr1 [Podospora fimiseda]